MCLVPGDEKKSSYAVAPAKDYLREVRPLEGKIGMPRLMPQAQGRGGWMVQKLVITQPRARIKDTSIKLLSCELLSRHLR